MDELEEKHGARTPNVFIMNDVFLPVMLMRENYIQRLMPYYLSVDTHGKSAKGALIIDHYNVTRNPPNAVVIAKVDVEIAKQCLLEYLAWK